MNIPTNEIDRDFWAGRRVFITGHMGFKGAWLCALLSHLGAKTFGFGCDRRPDLLYRDLDLCLHQSQEGDINEAEAMKTALTASGADVLLHLAAQPLVLTSYSDPVGTFETNLMGTVRMLDVARGVPSLKAIVVVTTDKVYHNNEWAWGYREVDELGGADPYSASKAAAEIAARAMAISYFSSPGGTRIATARAGNVIGGGDWADNRLIPDAVKALLQKKPVQVRNPRSTRPWQHVLDPLAGYMMLAQRLVSDKENVFGSWNFGPAMDDILSVQDVIQMFTTFWGDNARWTVEASQPELHKEAGLLAVDSTLARSQLGWRPRWNAAEAVKRTAYWYRRRSEGVRASMLVDGDIADFLAKTSEQR